MDKRIKLYKCIHASEFYKHTVVNGNKTAWQDWLYKRFGAKSCTELDTVALLKVAKIVQKPKQAQGTTQGTDDKIVPLFPHLPEDAKKRLGQEQPTEKQLRKIGAIWYEIRQIMKLSGFIAENAFNGFLQRTCGKRAAMNTLTKKQASLLIIGLERWRFIL